MTDEITLDDTPEIRRAYAIGLRKAAEVCEFHADTHPWWLPFRPQARRYVATMRACAEIIDGEATGLAKANEEKSP